MEDLENFNIEWKTVELEEWDTNYSSFVDEIEKIQDNLENIDEKNILKLFWLLKEITDELYNNKYIQKNFNEILEKIVWNNLYLNKRLKFLELLEDWEYKNKTINDVKKGVIDEEKEKDEKESSTRNIKFEQNKVFKLFSNAIKSEEIETEIIKNLRDVDSDTTILTFHKVMKDEIINTLWRLGINIKFSRKWFTSIKLPNWEKIVFIPTKDIWSTTNFSDFEEYQEEVESDKEILTVEDYLEQEWEENIDYVTKKTKWVFFLWWTDMTDLFKSKEWKESMVKLAEINSLLAFGSKAEFLLASDEDSLERIIAWETPSILSTKYTGVWDKMNEVLLQKAEVKYYGSNSEWWVQKEKAQNKNKVVMNLEAVQSGASMKDTGNFVYRKEIIDWEEKVVAYFPTKRWKNWDYEQKDIRFIFDKEDKYMWLFDSLDVVQKEMNLELSQVNIKTRDKVNDIVWNITEGSVKEFLINIFNFRWRELAKFKRIETEPWERLLIKLDENLLKDEKLMKQLIDLYKEVYWRKEYEEKYSEKKVYKIIQNLIEKGWTWLIRQNNYKKVIWFMASVDLENASEIKSEIKEKLEIEIWNKNKNYYIAETGSPEWEREELDFQNMLKQIIKEKWNYIARTNLVNSDWNKNKKIIKMYQNAWFKILGNINDTMPIPWKKWENKKFYLVYKNN